MNSERPSRQWLRAIGQLLVFIAAMMVVVGAIFAIVDTFFPGLEDVSGYIQAVLEVASIVFAVFTLRSELTETQKLEEAEFITSLNERFSDNEACQKVFAYAIWEGNAKTKRAHESGEKILDQAEYERICAIVEDEPAKPSQTDLSGYLTFFESIYLLLGREVITWEMVNELFKYRFFSGVHSDYVQSERLVRLPENFKNIYYLEALWMLYNDNDASQIAGFGNRLEEACRAAGRHDRYCKIIEQMEREKHLFGKVRAARQERSGFYAAGRVGRRFLRSGRGA